MKKRPVIYTIIGLLAVFILLIMFWPKPEPEKLKEMDIQELVSENGRMVLKTTKSPFTGIVVDRRRDGSVISKSIMKEGKLHGLSDGFFTNQQIQVREMFESGVSNGKRITWYSNGSTQTVAEIHLGVLDGPFLRYHENGSLSEKVIMKNGQPDGLAQAWYPNGNPKSIVTLKGGEVVESEYLDDTNQVESNVQNDQ